MGGGGADRQPGGDRDRRDRDPRPSRPHAESRELPAASMLFRPGQEPGRREASLPELEVPSVPVSAAHHRLPLPAEPRLEGGEALGRRAPMLAPQHHRPRARRHEGGNTPPTPQREAMLHPTNEPRERP